MFPSHRLLGWETFQEGEVVCNENVWAPQPPLYWTTLLKESPSTQAFSSWKGARLTTSAGLSETDWVARHPHIPIAIAIQAKPRFVMGQIYPLTSLRRASKANSSSLSRAASMNSMDFAARSMSFLVLAMSLSSCAPPMF